MLLLKIFTIQNVTYVRQKNGSMVNLEDQNLILIKSNTSMTSRDKVTINSTDGKTKIKIHQKHANKAILNNSITLKNVLRALFYDYY